MKKLVGYITSSYPDNSFTVDLALSMKESGVDSLELGIPFSDPVADGPVIEKANQLALQNGFSLEDLFEVSAKIAPNMDTLWMGYMNPFFRYGFENFLKKADEYGVNGMIIPDVPFEEGLLLNKLFRKYNKVNISFVAPTHSENRIKRVVSEAEKLMGGDGSGRVQR